MGLVTFRGLVSREIKRDVTSTANGKNKTFSPLRINILRRICPIELKFSAFVILSKFCGDIFSQVNLGIPPAGGRFIQPVSGHNTVLGYKSIFSIIFGL